MSSTALAADIAALEASLDSPSTPAAEALAQSVATRLLATDPAAPPAARDPAVRGLLLASHQFYRAGHMVRSRDLVRAALALAGDVDASLRITVLLRSGELDLLDFDVAAALEHTATAMDIAHATGKVLDEARTWVNYGIALDYAGLYPQADEHWAHALELLEGRDEHRLRGNIWALRCPLGFRLREGGDAQAEEACRHALESALAAPMRFRDSMASTALCNHAALDLQRGRVELARERLGRAAGLANLGVRPRWLIAVLRAMADVREHNAPETRAALDALLTGEGAPAAVYVIETFAVMAAMYADMGDARHAGEALERLSKERARALWAMLRAPEAPASPTAQRLPRWPTASAGDSTSLLERLAVTAELRDDATGKHCFRVGRFAMLLGKRAGLPEADIAGLELAARLHDIGKLVIPDAILLKPGKLDATEMHLMQTHTTIGAEILSIGGLPLPAAAREIARHHHERWDGTGYPDGLGGESIPLAARVAALADVYDALTHARPYKAAWSHDEAVGYIASMSGRQFDPRLTRLFLQIMAEAQADLQAFLAEVESAAAASAFALAQARVARTLAS